MNLSKTRHFFRNAAWLAALAAVLFAAGAVRAADGQQTSRFLLIFETSPALKKNLPMVRQVLNGLFASNLQHEMQADDDLAVWTVDQTLHTGTFPLESWSPADAQMYSERLGDFLAHQKYTRHASLAAIQPLLNQVAKGSEGLTVLIFCDSQSRLAGTPYDSGVNDIITNAAARPSGAQSFYVLVLRSYHGEYLGCSVNRSGPLNFPTFPAPPPPEPPPEVIKSAPAPVVAPAAPVSGPVVSPVPALIIVGTNATTNVLALTSDLVIKPVATPAPPPITQTTNTASATVPITSVPATMPQAVAPPASPAPVLNPAPPPSPAPAPALPKPSAPVPVAVSPPVSVAPARPPAAMPASTPVPVAAAATPESTPADTGYFLPLLIGGGALVVAAGLVIWLVARTRRPQGSLITSSMQDDPRLPPRN